MVQNEQEPLAKLDLEVEKWWHALSVGWMNVEMPRKYSLDLMLQKLMLLQQKTKTVMYEFSSLILSMSAGVGFLPSAVSFSCFYLGNCRYCRLKQRCGDGVQFTIFPAHLYCTCSCFNVHLVGGFNPYELYESNWISSPIFKDKSNKKKWFKPPPSHPSIHPILTAPKRSQKESKGGP